MKKIYLSVLSAIVLLNTACSPERETPLVTSTQSASMSSTSSVTIKMASSSSLAMPNTANNELMETEWQLIALNDQDVINIDGERKAHIIFNEENRVVMHDGCNQVTGSFNVDGEKLVFSDMASTRMACAGVADQPEDFNKALAEVATYSRLSDQLTFRDAQGVIVARFQAAAQPDAQ